MRKILGFLFGSLLWFSAASAQTIIGTLPFTLQNGSVADANQVMSDFNTIVSAVNSNAAAAGANTNITALNGLTTPLSYTAGGSSFYIGGTSSNSGNNYTVASPVPTGFTLVTGKVVSFTVNVANTGATQLNVNGTGLTNFFRQTTTGPAPMVGGEMQANMAVLAYYDGTQFECLNCVQLALAPTGTVADFTGVVVPSGWVLANGTALSRTTFSILYNVLAFTSVSATTTNTSTSIVVPNSALFQIGWFVGGNNVTCNSTISSIPDGTHIVINNAAGAGGATTLSIGPYQQGDCSTTFNLPNLTGRIAAGVDGATNITSATCTNPASLGASCGAQTQTLTASQIPVITSTGATSGNLSVTVSGIGIGVGQNGQVSADGVSAIIGVQGNGSAGSASGATSGSISVSTTSNNAGGAAHPILPPVSLVYKIIKT